ncbi:hypothetical protein C2857_005183 [Epichloe festucae Fl1]|uniref:Uncharacterized protein n=1 Tax=Epichloe festucae (strain Fl1) TaxID=877507 RepID=A0A7S9KSJ8_EPIFF|nr:hypothetical protein C2857_005183 [Epichloe festucae Fl1]
MSPGSDLQLSTAERRPCDVRRPRFHEDFDAPFSEALLNASTVTLASGASASSPSSEHPSDMSLSRAQHPQRPVQSREDSWSSTDSSRNTSSTGVNDRIKSWARRSFLPSRHPEDGQTPRSS